MPKVRVYIETTIPSLYFDARLDAAVVARRASTRHWWQRAAERYELVTSEVVLDELARGESERSAERLALVAGIPLLPIEPVVEQIVRTYVRHKLMPAAPGGDAVHLALASYHACDALLTWNCRHLANANKLGHIRRVNALLGLPVPALNLLEASMSTPDPAIDEVREVRRQISEQFEHDPARLVEYYIKLQERHRDRLLPSPKQPDPGKSAA